MKSAYKVPALSFWRRQRHLTDAEAPTYVTLKFSLKIAISLHGFTASPFQVQWQWEKAFLFESWWRTSDIYLLRTHILWGLTEKTLKCSLYNKMMSPWNAGIVYYKDKHTLCKIISHPNFNRWSTGTAMSYMRKHLKHDNQPKAAHSALKRMRHSVLSHQSTGWTFFFSFISEDKATVCGTTK